MTAKPATPGALTWSGVTARRMARRALAEPVTDLSRAERYRAGTRTTLDIVFAPDQIRPIQAPGQLPDINECAGPLRTRAYVSRVFDVRTTNGAS